jgi:hypothetical protein
MIKVLDEVIGAAAGLASCGVIICLFLYLGMPIDMATGVSFFVLGIIVGPAAIVVKVAIEICREKRSLSK